VLAARLRVLAVSRRWPARPGARHGSHLAPPFLPTYSQDWECCVNSRFDGDMCLLHARGDLLCPASRPLQLALFQRAFNPLDEKACRRHQECHALFLEAVRDPRRAESSLADPIG
jgi:hypothetical protein